MKIGKSERKIQFILFLKHTPSTISSQQLDTTTYSDGIGTQQEISDKKCLPCDVIFVEKVKK